MCSNQSNVSVDRKLSFFISFSFLLVAVNRVFTLPFASSYQTVVSLGQWCCFFCLFLYNYQHISKRIHNLLVNSYVLFSLLYIFSCLFSFLRNQPIDLIISHEVVWTLFFFLPVGLAAFAVKNYKILYIYLYKYSYIISALCIFYSVYRLYINPFGNSYDMAFGYILLVPALFHCSEFKKSRNVFVLIIFIIELVFLLLFGSRGVIIGIVSYLFLDTLFKAKTKLDKFKLFVPIIVLFVVYVQLPRINDYLESQDIYSRTIYKLATGDEDDDTNGRSNHWDAGWDLVVENPLIGYGLGGYYYDFHKVISRKHPEELYAFDPELGIWVKSGVSVSGAHSGFIDMMLFFGVLLGFPLALYMLFSIFRLRDIRDSSLFDLILIFYCSHIIGNMIVGGGIFTKPGCAIYLYLIYKIIKQKNSIKQVDDSIISQK